MNNNTLITIPKTLLYKILSEMKAEELSRICTADRYLSKICRSEDFWLFKHRTSFNRNPDFRKIFFQEQFQQLQKDALYYRKKVEDEIYSLVKSTLIPGSDNLARILSQRSASVSFSLDDFESFYNGIMNLNVPANQLGAMAGTLQVLPQHQHINQLLQQVGIPRFHELAPYIQDKINPNARIFQNLDPSISRDKPLLYRILIEEIYNIIGKYNPIMVQIYENTEELNQQLEKY